MTVSVLVPWRGDGGARDAAWRWVSRWWAREHPGWQVVVGACPDGPWVKALAVADALTRADGDTLVIADADVVCAGVGAAVAAVQAGIGWAIPHRKVRRLTQPATAAVLAGGPLTGPLTQPPYTGIAGGGLVVLPRTAYQQAPFDPRFGGWGQEDLAAGRVWSVLYGRPRRGPAELWHLWHPPQPRMSRAVGSRAGLALYRRYRAARTQAQVRVLLDEIRAGRVTVPTR